MASGHEGEVVESMRELMARVEELPTSDKTAALVRAATDRLERALRATGHELGRPKWMKP